MYYFTTVPLEGLKILGGGGGGIIKTRFFGHETGFWGANTGLPDFAGPVLPKLV